MTTVAEETNGLPILSASEIVDVLTKKDLARMLSERNDEGPTLTALRRQSVDRLSSAAKEHLAHDASTQEVLQWASVARANIVKRAQARKHARETIRLRKEHKRQAEEREVAR